MPTVSDLGVRWDETRWSPWTAQWVTLFDAEAARIRRACTNVVVEHVGSTAVPGLPAKPIIDMLVGYKSRRVVDAVSAMVALGHSTHTEKDRGDRIFLWLGEGDISRYHANVTPIGSDTWQALLDFRDLLRVDATAREQYKAAKTALAQRYATERTAYLEAKSAVIGDLFGRVGKP